MCNNYCNYFGLLCAKNILAIPTHWRICRMRQKLITVSNAATVHISFIKRRNNHQIKTLSSSRVTAVREFNSTETFLMQHNIHFLKIEITTNELGKARHWHTQNYRTKEFSLGFLWLQKAEKQRFVYLIAQGYSKINLSGLYAQGCFMFVVMAH